MKMYDVAQRCDVSSQVSGVQRFWIFESLTTFCTSAEGEG